MTQLFFIINAAHFSPKESSSREKIQKHKKDVKAFVVLIIVKDMSSLQILLLQFVLLH